MQSTLTSKGQITVPKEIRNKLRLKPGDKLQFFLRENGQIEVIAKGADIRELKGMIPPPRKGVSLQKMNEAIVRGATDP